MSCKKSCDANCLTCIVCLYPFHSSCVKIPKRQYKAILTKDKNFVCSKKCYNATFPFSEVDEIDLLCTLFGDNMYPCKKCKRDCIGNGLMNCIQCEICLKWQHSSCANLEFPFDYYVDKNLDFFCSKKCELSVLPFNHVINNDRVDEFNPKHNNFPC